MNAKSAHSVETLFTLLVFCLFSVCSLFLVLIGANVYRGIVGDMNANNETRASLSYVSNKVHAAGTGETSLQTINGKQALVISAQYNGEAYRTYIYEHNGYLMELFTRADNPFTPGDGDKITAISGFQMTQNGNSLNLSATGSDRRTLTLSLQL
jgi:hypothetical protein